MGRALCFILLADKMHFFFSAAAQITGTDRLLLLNFKSSQELCCGGAQREEPGSVFCGGEEKKGFYFLAGIFCLLRSDTCSCVKPLSYTGKFNFGLGQVFHRCVSNAVFLGA